MWLGKPIVLSIQRTV